MVQFWYGSIYLIYLQYCTLQCDYLKCVYLGLLSPLANWVIWKFGSPLISSHFWFITISLINVLWALSEIWYYVHHHWWYRWLTWGLNIGLIKKCIKVQTVPALIILHVCFNLFIVFYAAQCGSINYVVLSIIYKMCQTQSHFKLWKRRCVLTFTVTASFIQIKLLVNITLLMRPWMQLLIIVTVICH